MYECLGDVAKWAVSVDNVGSSIAMAAGMKCLQIYSNEQGPYRQALQEIKSDIRSMGEI